MQKPITYNQLVRHARLYLIRHSGNILGNRDYDVFDYEALTRQVFGASRTFSWFLDVFEEHHPRFQAGEALPVEHVAQAPATCC